MTCIHHPNHYYPGNDQAEVSSLRRNVPGPIPGSHSSAVVEGGGAISQRMPWLMVKIFQHLCASYWLSYFFGGGYTVILCLDYFIRLKVVIGFCLFV